MLKSRADKKRVTKAHKDLRKRKKEWAGSKIDPSSESTKSTESTKSSNSVYTTKTVGSTKTVGTTKTAGTTKTVGVISRVNRQESTSTKSTTFSKTIKTSGSQADRKVVEETQTNGKVLPDQTSRSDRRYKIIAIAACVVAIIALVVAFVSLYFVLMRRVAIQNDRKTQLYKVKVPETVAFMATTAKKVLPYTKEMGDREPLVFEIVTLNIGGSYNPITGVFTCKIPGVYRFTANIFGKGMDATNPDIHSTDRKTFAVQLRVNDKAITSTSATDEFLDYGGGSMSAVVDLKLDDKVFVARIKLKMYMYDSALLINPSVFCGERVA